MPWIDGGNGQWVWQEPSAAELGAFGNSRPAMPSGPPPSARSSGAPPGAGTPGGPSIFGQVKHDAGPGGTSVPGPVLPGPAPAAPGVSLAEADQISRGNSIRAMRDDIASRNTAGGTSAGLLSQLDTSGQFGGAARPSPAARVAGAAPNPVANQLGGVGAGGAPARQQAPGVYGQVDTSGGTASKVDQAADQARDAVGPAPQVDMGLADRGYDAFQESLAMSREVLDRLLNSPSVTSAIGDQALASQLAIQRSVRGGPGAVAAASDAALNAAPQVTQQAAIQASSEDLARTSAAGQVASNFAQAALGGRQQDIGIATANQNAAVNVMQQITQLTGTQLQLDQQNQELIGQMARDFASLDYNWAALSFEQQQKEFDRWVTVYGIDKNFAAQIKAISASKKIGPMDVFNGIVGVLGGAATVATAAIKGP